MAPPKSKLEVNLEGLAEEIAKIISPPQATPLRPEEFLPTFSGEPEEDPEKFIKKINDYFDSLPNIPAEHKPIIAIKQFRGAAHKWYKQIPRVDPSISDLWETLKEQYGSEENCDKLQEIFYGRRYDIEKDEVGTFIQKQKMLYERFTLVKDEKPLISRLLRQMPKEIRPFLVTARCKSIKDLIKMSRTVLNTCPELAESKPPKKQFN